MSSNSRLDQARSAFPRFVIRDDPRWFQLITTMRFRVANIAPKPRRQPPAAPIRENDFVRTRRDLVVGRHRITCGSLGTVTTIHPRRPLVDVAFFTDQAVSVTLAGYELLRTSA